MVFHQKAARQAAVAAAGSAACRPSLAQAARVGARIPPNTSTVSAVPPKRSFSTTSSAPASFGSWLPSSSSKRQPKITPEALISAVNGGDIATARRSYEALLADSARSGRPALTPGQVNLLLSDLSHKSDARALALLKRIYGDLATWGVDRTRQHARDMLRAMCTVGKVSEAFTFGDEMGLDVTQWREMLGAASKHDADVIPRILDKIRPHGLNAKDYSKLFRSLRDTMPDDAPAQLDAILAEMDDHGIKITVPEQQASLARLHIALGQLDQAMAIIGQWDMPRVRSLMMWNTRVEYQVAVGDVQAVKATTKRMREKDMAASQVALSFLVRREIEEKIAHTPELRWTDVVGCITKVEKETESRTQDWVWAEVINLIMERTGDVQLVLQVYDEARALGVSASSRVVRAVLLPLLQSQPVRFEKALDVYADFASQPIAMKDQHSRTRVTAIYAMLLAAASSRPAIDPSIPLRLLQDMRANDVHLSGKLLSSLLVSLIRSSPDHDTAFNYYAHAYVAASGAFDADAYSEITLAFLDLSTEDSPFPPANYVFELVRDMQTAGFRLSNHTLSRLLTTYGSRATPSRKSSTDPIFRQRKIDKIHRAISDVHALMNMGSLVIPDVPLLAALMDAYSRVGAYTSAFQVWDQLLERRQREDPAQVPTLYGPAVSIILDTCGRSDQYNRGVKIANWAKRFKVASPKVLESWVECLCRLQRYEEAAQVVCMQMQHLQPEEVKEAARIVLKFSWRNKAAYQSTQEQVKAAWPAIWDDVKAVVETSRNVEISVDEELEI